MTPTKRTITIRTVSVYLASNRPLYHFHQTPDEVRFFIVGLDYSALKDGQEVEEKYKQNDGIMGQTIQLAKKDFVLELSSDHGDRCFDYILHVASG
jgi:hypothetical protein